MADPTIPFECTNMSDCSANCPYIGRITKLETQQDHITPMMNKMDSKLDTVILGLSRVEILELKHSTHSESLNRAFNRIEAVEEQARATAKVLADLLSQIKGMTRLAIIIWAGTGATVAFLINRVI